MSQSVAMDLDILDPSPPWIDPMDIDVPVYQGFETKEESDAEDGGWTKAMKDIYKRYKKAEDEVKVLKIEYKIKVQAIQNDIEHSRRTCDNCLALGIECNEHAPCGFCVAVRVECHNTRHPRRPNRPERKNDQSRPTFLWEMSQQHHADLVYILQACQYKMGIAVEQRLKLMIDYPHAFNSDPAAQLGHFNAINVAKQETCAVTGRLVDHLMWRDARPEERYGEPWIKFNRSTMANCTHYGQHKYPSTSQSPSKRLLESKRDTWKRWIKSEE